MQNKTTKVVLAAALLSLVAVAAGAESRKWEARFDRLDSNKDGRISQSELDARRQAAFRAMDTNSDGIVSQEEYKAAVLARMTPRLEKRYAKLDRNDDGKLSPDEIGRHKRNFIERMDTNGDGAISKQEAKAAAERRHKRHHQ